MMRFLENRSADMIANVRMSIEIKHNARRRILLLLLLLLYLILIRRIFVLSVSGIHLAMSCFKLLILLVLLVLLVLLESSGSVQYGRNEKTQIVNDFCRY